MIFFLWLGICYEFRVLSCFKMSCGVPGCKNYDGVHKHHCKICGRTNAHLGIRCPMLLKKQLEQAQSTPSTQRSGAQASGPSVPQSTTSFASQFSPPTLSQQGGHGTACLWIG